MAQLAALASFRRAELWTSSASLGVKYNRPKYSVFVTWTREEKLRDLSTWYTIVP
jgi:hypothetical protein